MLTHDYCTLSTSGKYTNSLMMWWLVSHHFAAKTAWIHQSLTQKMKWMVLVLEAVRLGFQWSDSETSHIWRGGAREPSFWLVPWREVTSRVSHWNKQFPSKTVGGRSDVCFDRIYLSKVALGLISHWLPYEFFFWLRPCTDNPLD